MLSILLLTCVFMCGCRKENEISGESFTEITEEFATEKNISNVEEETAEQLEKGYDLPVNDNEREEAEADCKHVMEMISEIYRLADKGEASNVVISDETMIQMKEVIKEKGYPVTSSERYVSMENYEEMDTFLESCMEGKTGAIVMYEVYSRGSIGRMKYIFDGSDMYVFTTNAIWNKNNQPGIAYHSYTQIKEWEYTNKGWFCYELCVPEYPEVTEVVNGSRLVRVKPLSDEYRELSEKYVLPLGYKGNNLLCSNWNAKTLEDLDYNGMYEYLYAMKYEEPFDPESYSNGIPVEEFENVIMEYIPITPDQIRKWAVFDEEYGTYAWTKLGCMNYVPTYFGTSLPEVIYVEENADGTVTLTVDAVCEMILCNDAVITHELTVRFLEDGSFEYLSNEILNNGIQDITEYQYRFENKKQNEE